jgi:hypothetical protein
MCICSIRSIATPSEAAGAVRSFVPFASGTRPAWQSNSLIRYLHPKHFSVCVRKRWEGEKCRRQTHTHTDTERERESETEKREK